MSMFRAGWFAVCIFKARRYIQKLLYSDHQTLRFVRWVVTFCIIAVCIWFIVRKAHSEYVTISTSHAHPDIVKILVSWLCITASTLLAAWEWALLIKALGGRLNTITGMRIHLISVLSKYIPGYIWPYLGKAHLTIRHGVPASIAIFSVIGELFIVYLSGTFLLLVSLPFSGLMGETTSNTQTWAALVSGGAIAVCLLGFLVDNRFGKFLRFEKIANWKGVVFVIVAITLTWCLLGFGFYMLDASLEPSVGNPWRLFAGLISALLGGQLAFFVPMGIGVREAILVAFFNLDKPAWLVILVAMIFRLETTLGEVFSTLLVVLWSIAKRAHILPKGDSH